MQLNESTTIHESYLIELNQCANNQAFSFWFNMIECYIFAKERVGIRIELHSTWGYKLKAFLIFIFLVIINKAINSRNG